MNHSTRQALIEDSNYHRDPRTYSHGNRWWLSIDRGRSTAQVEVLNPIDDEEDEIVVETVPVRFVVCDTCQGRGSYVNPSVDASGFEPDGPDDMEAYRSGQYDVSCGECEGATTVPVPVDESVLDRLAYEGDTGPCPEQLAEMRMGA